MATPIQAPDPSAQAPDPPNYKYKNGRRYRAYREGQYVLPNGEAEQDRQDLLHHVRNLVLNGRLFVAPLQNPHRLIDIGAGTGVWATDFDDEFPGAEVIGTDLSPIQPSWVPPNLHFQVDDAEAPWVYTRPFDFVHTRDLGGSISDWPKLIGQAYTHLKPGGWIELQEFEYLERLHKASEMFNKPMNTAEGYKQRLIDAGFQCVRDDIYKDPKQKEIGRYNLCSLLMAVEAYLLALFTRILGWTNEATQVFLAGVRKDLRNRAVHSHCNLQVVYGRKPTAVPSV
ncbi:S-adenosyl-L-methionine-dependent methyltransferase [Lepidopterella palustris CBS 459.81]|uniref:S-adenosyl-L-methionine-dependent methyltransferase n=1 Tax=Lepidopterella palustris CBS 459.81 TaxID=1314670 RepID=A0A8E2JCN2_9PEZI|nr:S-adenosyl-L-methionine-dependent methyltransferase [Lepidopterella palustris CBS 459.81]